MKDTIDLNWRTGEKGSKIKDYGNPILNEEHHKIYGRPWLLGRDYYNFLLCNKLVVPDSHVLDFGCGVGRVGIWILTDQKNGHYVGIDNHIESLEIYKEYEIPLHGVCNKSYELLTEIPLGFEKEVKFDVILDFFSTFHIKNSLGNKALLVLYSKFTNLLVPNGKIVISHALHLSEEELNTLGLTKVRNINIELALLTKFSYRKNKNTWVILEKLP